MSLAYPSPQTLITQEILRKLYIKKGLWLLIPLEPTNQDLLTVEQYYALTVKNSSVLKMGVFKEPAVYASTGKNGFSPLKKSRFDYNFFSYINDTLMTDFWL